MITKWIRTCQECGHRQEAKMPSQNKALTQSFLDLKCKKCKSQGFDYGREVHFDENGLIIEAKDDFQEEE